MTKDQAIEAAKAETNRTGATQGIWLVGPGQYATTILKPRDSSREGFLGSVFADGMFIAYNPEGKATNPKE